MTENPSPLPRTIACWSCGAQARLEEEKFQGYILDEDGEEHDVPMTFGTYACACGESTQAVFDHRRDLLHVQEEELKIF
jgi:hypothetical protein